MKKGMNNYLAGIMICLLVTALIIIVYALSKNDFQAFNQLINKITVGLGL